MIATAAHAPAPASTRALNAYVAAVIAVGSTAIVTAIAQLPQTPFAREWALFAVLGVLAGTYAVKVPGITARISVSDTFFLASAMLFGPAPAMLALGADSAVMSWRRSYSRTKLLFNACGPALSLYVAAHVFFLLADAPPLAGRVAPVGGLILPLAGMTITWFLLNSGLTAAAIALDSGTTIFVVWKRFAVLSINYAAAASASFCIVLVVAYANLMAAVAVLPLVFIFHLTIRSWLGRLDDAQQHIAKIDRLYLSTVETLATAIEAKDGVTHDHIRRVQIYAVGLARALGVHDDATIKAIEAAALLHDTGKLAVPEHILNKPGKLTAVEFEQMKLHVDVGADILSAIDFPYPVVPIVRCHHENWDGSGYPRGVKGTEIPIGARILSVVDCYDALTSDRPYRRALSDEAAIAILRERRGTMYDPLVVDAFIRVLPAISQRALPPTPHHEALAHISRSAAPAQAAAPSPPAPDRSDTPEDLLALVNLARVVTRDSPHEDVLLLAAGHVRRVIPRGSCVLYLAGDDGEELQVRHAAGPLAPALRGATIRVGHKLTGWVAAHRRTIVNSDAALDLCDLVAAGEQQRICLSAALCDGETLIGVLTLYADAAEPFSEEHGRLAQMMAPHLARMFAVSRRTALASAPPRPAAGPPPDVSRDLRIVASR
jgi:putative nucleotidyltransferase with HDIG domain